MVLLKNIISEVRISDNDGVFIVVDKSVGELKVMKMKAYFDGVESEIPVKIRGPNMNIIPIFFIPTKFVRDITETTPVDSKLIKKLFDAKISLNIITKLQFLARCKTGTDVQRILLKGSIPNIVQQKNLTYK